MTIYSTYVCMMSYGIHIDKVPGLPFVLSVHERINLCRKVG